MKKINLLRLRLGIVAGCALAACGGASAAISCNLNSNGFSSAYVPANAAINITSASLAVTCTRTASGDATSQLVTVKANNGLNRAGRNQNQASSGANVIAYDIYTNSSCVTKWNGGTTLSATVIFTSASDFAPKSATVPYWGCIPAAQIVPAATYTDTVTMTPSVGVPATFPVSIVTPSSCTISSPPSNMTFNYIAFQGSAASATSNFSATCTSLLPYSMALDATSSVLTGLVYTLSLSASSSIGTGVAQSHTVNGSMAAGQSGTCATGSCSATEARTLTISY